MIGTVRKYISNKGYGFIDGEDGDSYFFHIRKTNLDPAKRYELDNLMVEFTPHREIVDNVIKSHAEDVIFHLK